jgi:Ca-activated chloride channel family protein
MKKVTYNPLLLFSFIMIAFLFSSCAPAQDASKERADYSASYAATLAAQGYASEAELKQGILPADELRVEEYLNYYDQTFPAPPEGMPIGLNALLGSTSLPSAGGEAWLQIGLQAADLKPSEKLPTNLVLVLDKSGSMSEKDKMTYLKQSLEVLVSELDPQDTIAIVVYDTEASVLLPAQPVGDRAAVRQAIASLQPGSRTNLHGGLMLGYQEAMKNYSAEVNNRVILFTDGIANVGETDPATIARDSKAYNLEGIYLSTIGLGLEMNDKLLSTLAEQGKGNYHFISGAEEMERVFKEELAGLMQTVATKVWMTMELGDLVQVNRIYGYEYKLEGRTLTVQFDDAGAGGNQILMVRLIVPADQGPAGEGSQQTLADITLSYQDTNGIEQIPQKMSIPFSYGAPEPYDPLISPLVRRNATILRMAETLQQVSYWADERKYEQALSAVQVVKADVWEIATQEGDPQLQEDLETLNNYEAILTKLVEVANAPTPVIREVEQRPPDQPMPCPSPAAFMGLIAAVVAVNVTKKCRTS